MIVISTKLHCTWIWILYQSENKTSFAKYKVMNAASKKIVVVTGAARGIGWGIANRLARAGHQIVILDADGDTLQDRLDQAIKEEMHITGQICDVTDQKNVESCIQSVIGEYGR